MDKDLLSDNGNLRITSPVYMAFSSEYLKPFKQNPDRLTTGLVVNGKWKIVKAGEYLHVRNTSEFKSPKNGPIRPTNKKVSVTGRGV